MRILIVDDEVDYSLLLKQRLMRKKIVIDVAHDIKTALQLLDRESYDVVLLDQLLPDGDGQELLIQIKENDSFIEVVLLTGHGTVERATNSIKQGAYDYLTKPCSAAKLEFTLQKAYEKKRLAEHAAGLSDALRRQSGSDPIIGKSIAIKEVITMVDRVKDTNATVLISGDSGSGKELVARSLHFLSERRKKPLQAINCAALPTQIVESELFGHEKGSFTGAVTTKVGIIETVEGGTLFLDEIAEMDLGIQAKILRLLEAGEYFRVGATRSRKVNLRVIAATNKNLEHEVELGRFREDLYYRLNVFQIHVPSLRNRKEDIPLIAEYLLKTKIPRGKYKYLSSNSIKVLQNYDFPGNVRELANMLERGALLSSGEEIEPKYLFQSYMNGMENIQGNQQAEEELDNLSLASVEKEHIKKVLQKVDGNKTKAANKLGIGVKTLYRKIKEYNI